MNHLPRRRLIVTSGTIGVTLFAGCGGSEDDSNSDGTDYSDSNGDDTGEAEPNGDDDAGTDDDWTDVDEFAFEGRIQAWTGIEPDVIDGEDNPTITLTEGNEYDFRWGNADGVTHNMEI